MNLEGYLDDENNPYDATSIKAMAWPYMKSWQEAGKDHKIDQFRSDILVLYNRILQIKEEPSKLDRISLNHWLNEVETFIGTETIELPPLYFQIIQDSYNILGKATTHLEINTPKQIE